ncbi:MBL fold metallo-hydrolase [Thermodesulfobacteriota bacterium]
MRIRCWGSRGSIPVSGKEYNKYGGDTTCIDIRTRDDKIIIIDAGTGIRRLGEYLIEKGRYTYDIIFTHAHWDHLMGFPFFAPIYNDKTHIRMQGCPFAQKFVEKMLSKIMSPPNFPVNYADIKARITYTPECHESFEIGNVSIIPIRLSHPNQGNGYKFIEDGKTFVFLTDNELDFKHKGGLPFEAYQEFSTGADLLIHDGEYTKEEYEATRQWGHSVYTTTLELALNAGVKRLGLFHLNQGRTDQEVDQMVDKCKEVLINRGSDLECFAVGSDMTFTL